jgi:DNA anti-recombination protein RmuC
MPVTAKLSKQFYEKLGEQVANELVDWFNAVDATYRADLRELNEVNFARFDAKLEQRIAELRSELISRIERLEALFESRLSAFEATLERRFGEQSRWFITAWAVLLLAIAGLWLRK